MDYILDDPRYFFYDLNIQRGTFEFVEVTRASLSGRPFLDKRFFHYNESFHSFPFLNVFKHFKTAERKSPPLNFLFHSAFCCSTLLAKCLDVEGKNLSLKEPMALVGLGGIKNTFFREQDDDPRWKQFFDLAFFLLGRRFNKAEKILIKPSNSVNILIEDAAASKKTDKSLLLYGSLERFLVSVIHGGREREQNITALLHGMVGNFTRYLPKDLPDIITMSPLEKAVLLWGLQLENFKTVLGEGGKSNFRTLDCDLFLEEPVETLDRVFEFLDIEVKPEKIEEIVASPVFLSHSKDPSIEFSRAHWIRRKNEILKYFGQRVDDAAQFAADMGFDPAPKLTAPILS